MELSVILFIIGAIVLLISTQIFIKQVERISVSLKLSPLIIGLTVVSIGTSLPELTVSTIAAIRGDKEYLHHDRNNSSIFTYVRTGNFELYRRCYPAIFSSDYYTP